MRRPSGEKAGSRMPVSDAGVCAEKAVKAKAATAVAAAEKRIPGCSVCIRGGYRIRRYRRRVVQPWLARTALAMAVAEIP